jgi:hypothetical protein
MSLWKWTTPNGQFGFVRAADDDAAWFKVITATSRAPEVVTWVEEVQE